MRAADLARESFAGLVIANAANAANSRASARGPGLRRVGESCESESAPADHSQGSQKFAIARSPASAGDSPHSQHSQTIEPECLSQALPGRWENRHIARFLAICARLAAWGWPEQAAERTAERIVEREAGDDRRSCVECLHYRPERCADHRRAGLQAADLGRDLARLLQRCPGFREVR